MGRIGCIDRRNIVSLLLTVHHALRLALAPHSGRILGGNMRDGMNNYWTTRRAPGIGRRRFLAGAGTIGVGTAAMALAGCGGDDDDDPQPTAGNGDGNGTTDPTQTPDSSSPQVGGHYRWAWQGTPHLDMHQDSISGASQIIAAAYNRLMRFQDDVQLPEPDLASAMPEQPDDLTFIFPIHEGVQFHDKAPVNGRVMTAQDVAFSLNRARTDDPLFVHKGDLASIDQIEAVDDTHVRITTSVPNSILLTTLAGYQFFVFAEETLNQFEDLKTDSAAIGTGPFVVESASTDRGANLVRHPNYWRTGQPYFESAEQIVIGDHWSQFLAGNLETAAVAAEVQQGFDSFEAVLEDAGVDGYTYQGLSYASAQGHFMNNGAPPFDDVRVREAINLILDRQPQLRYANPIVSRPSIALGWAQVDAGFGLPEEEMAQLRGYRQDEREQDIADGLALLEQAGYTSDNPLQWEIMGWAVPQRAIGIDNLQLAAEMYREVSGGVLQPSPVGLEWGVWKQAEARHEFQMISSAYSMGVDAHEAMAKMFSSTGGRNFAQFSDPDFDEMLLAAQAEFDLEQRKAMTQDMLRYLNDPSRIPNAWTGTGPGAAASPNSIRNRPSLFDAGKIDQMYFA